MLDILLYNLLEMFMSNLLTFSINYVFYIELWDGHLILYTKIKSSNLVSTFHHITVHKHLRIINVT